MRVLAIKKLWQGSAFECNVKIAICHEEASILSKYIEHTAF